MNRNGFYFSWEALIVLLLVVQLILMIPNFQSKDFQELMLLQQEGDLLKVWALESKFNPGEMMRDAEKMFPGRKIMLEINQTEMEINGFGVESITSEYRVGGIFPKKIRLSVFN